MGLIFLRCFLHPQQMGRANHIKVQILKKTIACKYDLTKNLNVLGTSWHSACQKVPWAMMIHSAKVTNLEKRVTCPSDQLLFLPTPKSGLTPKRNIFHSNLKHLGMSIYLAIISNHFSPENISKNNYLEQTCYVIQ